MRALLQFVYIPGFLRSLALLLAAAAAVLLSGAQPAAGEPLPPDPQNYAAQVVQQQAQYFAEHGRYMYIEELAQATGWEYYLDALYPSAQTQLQLVLGDGQSAYILCARTESQQDLSFAVYSSAGLLNAPQRLALVDAQAQSLARGLIAAENAYFAAQLRYGTLKELQAAGLVSGELSIILNQSGTEFGVTPAGAVFSLGVGQDGGYYNVTVSGASWRYTDSMDGELGSTLIDVSLDGMQFERQRNLLRSLTSAEYAYYAAHGSYGTLQQLAAEKYIGTEITGGEGAAAAGIGCAVAPGGQRFVATSRYAEQYFLSSETGLIDSYPLPPAGSPAPDLEEALNQLRASPAAGEPADPWARLKLGGGVVALPGTSYTPDGSGNWLEAGQSYIVTDGSRFLYVDDTGTMQYL